MNSATPLPSVFDTQSLAALKKGLRKDDPQALKATAQQFEALFLQMMLKSMRSTVQKNDLFDSDQTRFYQELLDSQLAQVMSAKGGTGLAAVIERQLSRSADTEASDPPLGMPLRPPLRSIPFDSMPRGIPLPAVPPAPTLLAPHARNPGALPPTGGASAWDAPAPTIPLEGSAVRPAIAPSASGDSPAQTFAAAVWPQAVAAGNAMGIPPQFLVAQAALESGWGKSEPRFADGRPSYNLFGIKAGSNWQGATVEASSTEYVNGVAEKRVERFRAYGSYAESFRDYAQLLIQSPRYAGVVGSRDAASFAQGLQRAGYATDPAYAAKLERVIGSLSLRASGTPKA